jgi:hypothetical protein
MVTIFPLLSDPTETKQITRHAAEAILDICQAAVNQDANPYMKSYAKGIFEKETPKFTAALKI